MLAHEQAFDGVQLHEEIILAGLLAGALVVIVVAVAALLGLLGVDPVDAALPYLVVHPAGDPNRHPLLQGADGLLGDGALHAVVVSGHDGDVGGLLLAAAVAVAGAAAVGGLDGADRALHRGVDGAVVQGLQHVLSLLALAGKLILLLADLQLLGLDVHLDVVLPVFPGPFQLDGQALHLLMAGLDAVLQPQDVQLKLFIGQLHALHVIAEQGRALLHLVPGGHQAFFDGEILVRVHLDDVLGLHYAGVPVVDPGRAHAGDGRHGLDEDGPLLRRFREEASVGVPAAVAQPPQDQEGQQYLPKCPFAFFHGLSPKLQISARIGQKLKILRTQNTPPPAPRRCATWSLHPA